MLSIPDSDQVTRDAILCTSTMRNIRIIVMKLQAKADLALTIFGDKVQQVIRSSLGTLSTEGKINEIADLVNDVIVQLKLDVNTTVPEVTDIYTETSIAYTKYTNTQNLIKRYIAAVDEWILSQVMAQDNYVKGHKHVHIETLKSDDRQHPNTKPDHAQPVCVTHTDMVKQNMSDLLNRAQLIENQAGLNLLDILPIMYIEFDRLTKSNMFSPSLTFTVILTWVKDFLSKQDRDRIQKCNNMDEIVKTHEHQFLREGMTHVFPPQLFFGHFLNWTDAAVRHIVRHIVDVTFYFPMSRHKMHELIFHTFRQAGLTETQLKPISRHTYETRETQYGLEWLRINTRKLTHEEEEQCIQDIIGEAHQDIMKNRPIRFNYNYENDDNNDETQVLHTNVTQNRRWLTKDEWILSQVMAQDNYVKGHKHVHIETLKSDDRQHPNTKPDHAQPVCVTHTDMVKQNMSDLLNRAQLIENQAGLNLLDILPIMYIEFDRLTKSNMFSPSLTFTVILTWVKDFLSKQDRDRIQKCNNMDEIVKTHEHQFLREGMTHVFPPQLFFGHFLNWTDAAVRHIVRHIVDVTFYFPMSRHKMHELIFHTFRQAGLTETQLKPISRHTYETRETQYGLEWLRINTRKLTHEEEEQCIQDIIGEAHQDIMKNRPIRFNYNYENDDNNDETQVLHTNVTQNRRWLTKDEFQKKYPKARYFETKEAWLQHKKDFPNTFKNNREVSLTLNTTKKFQEVEKNTQRKHEAKKLQQKFIGILNDIHTSQKFYLSFLYSRAFKHKYRVVVDSGSSVHLVPYHILNERDKKSITYIKHIGITTVDSQSTGTKIIGYMKLQLMNRLHKVYVGTHATDIMLLSATELAKKGLNLISDDQTWHLWDTKLSKKYSQNIIDGVVCLPPINKSNNIKQQNLQHVLHTQKMNTDDIEDIIEHDHHTAENEQDGEIDEVESINIQPTDRQATKAVEMLTHISHIHLTKSKFKQLLLSTNTNWKSTLRKYNVYCRECLRGKMRSFSHPLTLSHVNDKPGQHFSADMASIPQIGLNGEKLFMVIVDNYSKYIHVVPMISKRYEEVERIIKRIVYETNNVLSPGMVQTLKVDNARELIKTAKSSWFQELGMKLLTTVAGNPFQNGLAERTIGTLINDVRTTIERTGLPWILWPLILEHAAQLRNVYKVHTIMEDGKETYKTAWEMNTGTKPDLNWFDSFGCQMYIHGRNVNHVTKDKPKAIPCIYMGNNMCKRAHRVVHLNADWKHFLNDPSLHTFQKLKFEYSVDARVFNKIFVPTSAMDDRLQATLTELERYIGKEHTQDIDGDETNEQHSNDTRTTSGSTINTDVIYVQQDQNDNIHNANHHPTEDEGLTHFVYQPTETETDSSEMDVFSPSQHHADISMHNDITEPNGMGEDVDIEHNDVDTFTDPPEQETEPSEPTTIILPENIIEAIHDTPIIPSDNSKDKPRKQVDTTMLQLPSNAEIHDNMKKRIQHMTAEVKSQQGNTYSSSALAQIQKHLQTLNNDLSVIPPSLRNKHSGDMHNIKIMLAKYKKAHEKKWSVYLTGKEQPITKVHMLQSNEELEKKRIQASTIKLMPSQKAAQAAKDGSNEYAKLIVDAQNAEIDALYKNEVFTETTEKPPKGATLLRGRFILAVKSDEKGYATKIKARFVAMGNHQQPESYGGGVRAAVITKEQMKMLLLLQHGRHLTQIDISNAYQNATLKEDIYLYAPDKDGKWAYRKLAKTLYGLKQAGREWYQEIKGTLNGFGLHCSDTEECLFARKEQDGSTTLQAQYVDDMLISSKTKAVGEELVAKIAEKYLLRQMGEPKSFLNTEIERHEDKIYLSNKVKIDELQESAEDVQQYDAYPTKIMQTPIEQLQKVLMSQEIEGQVHQDNDTMTPLTPAARKPGEEHKWHHDLASIKTRLQEIIGSLTYIATSCRPDISTAVNMLATRISKPDDKILQHIARVLRYLKHTRNYELCLQDKTQGGKIKVEIYADASHDNGAKSKSRMGISVFMNGSLVKWTSKSIKSVCRSTTEAEIFAACEATKLAITYKNIIKDIFDETIQPIIYIDNSTCAKIQRDEVIPQETAYMINHFHFAKQYVQNKDIQIKSISTKDMLADGLTKALGKTKFWEQNIAWGLVDRTEHYEKINYVQVHQKEKGKCQNT